MKKLTANIDTPVDTAQLDVNAPRSPDVVKTHETALEVLLILRRRLIDRMAATVADQRTSLLNGHSHTSDPLQHMPEVAQMLRRLSELDSAIAGLADRDEQTKNGHSNGSADHARHVNACCTALERYVELVGANRLEEASRELSRLLQLPLDRVITATRFFARSMKADPKVVDALLPLAEHVQSWPEPECIKTLIRTFGFQSLESRQALLALRNAE